MVIGAVVPCIIWIPIVLFSRWLDQELTGKTTPLEEIPFAFQLLGGIGALAGLLLAILTTYLRPSIDKPRPDTD